MDLFYIPAPRVIFGIGFCNPCVGCHWLGCPAPQGPRPYYIANDFPA